MGGSTKQTQNTNQISTTRPWEQAMPAVGGLMDQIQGQIGSPALTGNQDAALTGLAGSHQNNQFLPQINSAVSGLLDANKGVTANLNEFRGAMQPYTTMDTNPYSNEAFTKATGYLTDDITNRIKSQYAGAGYSPVRAGNFSGSLAEGVSRGVAPAWLQASNDLENRKLGAINSVYNAGNTSAGLLGSLTPAAIGAAGTAQGMNQANADAPYLRMLETEAQRRGIPIQNLAQLESLIVPMAQLGGTTHTQGTAQSETKVPMAQQIMGGAIGGLGLLGGMGGFGPSGWLFGSGANANGLLNFGRS